MKEHAVLVPTSAGPIGAVVTEPRQDARLSLVLFPGGGDAGRSGINASWARAARAMAEHGVVVMRPDMPGLRESATVEDGFSTELEDFLRMGRRRRRALRRNNERAMSEVVDWLRKRRAGLRLLLAGPCAGAHLAATCAPRYTETAGIALIVPWLSSFDQLRKRGSRRWLGRSSEFDPAIVRALRQLPSEVRVRVLVGEPEHETVANLPEAVGAPGVQLEIEVVPGLALHPFRSPAAQKESAERLVAWVDEVAGWSPVGRARAAG